MTTNSPSTSDGPRILIVDDNRDIHEDIRKTLDDAASEAGDDLRAAESALFGDEIPGDLAVASYRFESAFQGQDALAKVQDAAAANDPYSVIFLDMRMPPGWDGLETLERIWAVDPDVQVVFCSAFSDYTWEAMVERLGVTDRFLILRKPFDSAEIRQMASALAEKWRLTQIARNQVESLEHEVDKRITELRLARDQAFQAEKLAAVGQLAAGIAHEINTPIQYIGDNVRSLLDVFSDLNAMIELYRELARKIAAGEDVQEMCQTIEGQARDRDLDFILEDAPAAIGQATEGVERVATIVRAMKDFSHINRTKISAIDINAAIESTLTIAVNEYKYIAEVERHFGNVDLVECIASEVSQVFLNLVVNAAHAIEEHRETGGLLTVTTSQHGDGDDQYIEIRIADNGVGIPPEIQDHIFEPFFTTKEVGKGSGQGLSIAYQTIVTKHNGALLVESEPGQGTCFIIRLPRLFQGSQDDADGKREAA